MSEGAEHSVDVLAELSSYQLRVEQLLEASFPTPARFNRGERTHLFLEEALELVQASGAMREDALASVDHVSERSAGEQSQELGGVMVTPAILFSPSDISTEGASDRKLERHWERVDLIRSKQQSKQHGSPLPR